MLQISVEPEDKFFLRWYQWHQLIVPNPTPPPPPPENPKKNTKQNREENTINCPKIRSFAGKKLAWRTRYSKLVGQCDVLFRANAPKGPENRYFGAFRGISDIFGAFNHETAQFWQFVQLFLQPLHVWVKQGFDRFVV